MIDAESVFNMESCLLQLLNWLGDNGYYARSNKEIEVLTRLEEKGFVKIKKGTRKVYVITKEGQEYWKTQALRDTLTSESKNSLQQPKISPTSIEQVSEEQLVELVTKAYYQLATDMRPLVQLPELRKIVLQQLGFDKDPTPQIIKHLDDLLLKLHHDGRITLQRAMTARDAPDGIWTPNGVFYYVTIQQQ